MIHKCITKRDLLRNPKDNFPKSPDEIITITDRGMPIYSLSMNAVSFVSQAEPNKNIQITKIEGKVTLYDHKQK